MAIENLEDQDAIQRIRLANGIRSVVREMNVMYRPVARIELWPTDLSRISTILPRERACGNPPATEAKIDGIPLHGKSSVTPGRVRLIFTDGTSREFSLSESARRGAHRAT